MEIKECKRFRLFVRVNNSIKRELNNLLKGESFKFKKAKSSACFEGIKECSVNLESIDSIIIDNTITFSKMVKKIMEEKNITSKDIYKNTLINRKLFSALNVNDDYIPSRETAIMYCFGLKLNYEESNKLIKLAGYTFNEYSNFDKIIKYFIDRDIYNIDKLNDALYFYTKKCLGYR